MDALVSLEASTAGEIDVERCAISREKLHVKVSTGGLISAAGESERLAGLFSPPVLSLI